MDTQGRIVGVNSAGATQFYDTEMSLASLLHPLLLTNLRAGVDIGPVRINANFPLIDFIARGVINTDGSEEYVGLRNAPEGITIGCRTHSDDTHAVFEDFDGYQANRRPTSRTDPVYGFKRKAT